MTFASWHTKSANISGTGESLQSLSTGRAGGPWCTQLVTSRKVSNSLARQTINRPLWRSSQCLDPSWHINYALRMEISLKSDAPNCGPDAVISRTFINVTGATACATRSQTQTRWYHSHDVSNKGIPKGGTNPFSRVSIQMGNYTAQCQKKTGKNC